MTADVEIRLAELEMRQRAHGEVLAALESVTTTVHQLSETVADLTMQVGLGGSGEKESPWPNPRWHELKPDGTEMAAELHRLKGFVKIAIPLLGWSGLPACTFQHMPAVLAIDVAAELHRVLWITEERSHAMVAQQADALTRVFPSLLASIHKAVNGCEHQAEAALARQTALLMKGSGA